MARIEFRTRKSDYVVEVPKGGNLLWTALGAGVPARYGCTEGTCGKCVCRLVAGQENLSLPNDQEYGRLGHDLVDQVHMRLACQVRVFGPARVEQR